MLRHWSYRVCARLLLIALLSSLLPGASNATGMLQPSAGRAESIAHEPAHRTVAPVVVPRLPGLTLHLAITPDPVGIGETATFTVTAENSTPTSANEVVISIPTPDGTLALPGPHTISPTQGWRMSLARLDGRTSAMLTGALRVVSMPRSQALLLRVAATAREATRPVRETAGAVVVDRSLDAATTRFTPGASAVLRSRDGRVSVRIPAQAAARPLTLRHSQSPRAGAAQPPGVVGF